MNLIGLVQALLINIRLLTGENDPQYKVTPVGFLQMLLENPVTAKIANEKQIREGQDLELKVRYMQRGLESEIEDEDNCDTSISATWLESSIGRPLLSKAGIFISDEDMRKYQGEAAATIAAGTNIQTPMMVALYETIMVKANGLIQSINSKLLTAQAAKWGTNVAYGDANAKSLNFGEKLAMNDGLVKLLLDGQANEVNGELILVGNGIVNAYNVLQGQKTGLDQYGFGKSNFKVYNDIGSTSKWGLNHFGAFAQGLVGLVDFNKNVGPYAGEKGGSVFFTLPIPVQLANGTLSTLVLDAQLKYQDCPIFSEIGVKVADRGWKLILSKSFGLWNAPDNMFAVTDRMAGFNGSLHYVGAIAPVTQEVEFKMVNVTGITTSDAAEAVAVLGVWDFASKLTIAPANATVKGIIYSTSDDAVATISQAGIVTGVAAGVATVTATTIDGSYKVTAVITVA